MKSEEYFNYNSTCERSENERRLIYRERLDQLRASLSGYELLKEKKLLAEALELADWCA